MNNNKISDEITEKLRKYLFSNLHQIEEEFLKKKNFNKIREIKEKIENHI